MTIEHVAAPQGEIHPPHNWEFANALARTNATITNSDLVGRLALQLDERSYWILTSISPLTWEAPKADPNPHTHTAAAITDLSTDVVPEGGSGNALYHTAARVRATLLAGLSTATNAVITASDSVLAALGKVQRQITDQLALLTDHVADINNPHGTTKEQLALGNVDNTADADKPISTATAAALAGKEPSLAAGSAAQYYRGDKTWQTLDKTAVGLDSVDNTADAAKPVSTAQATADAAVLATAKTYADGLVVGLYDDRGNYDASGNVFPSSGGSGAAGAIVKGDIWRISVPGTLGGKNVIVDEQVRALVDAPGQTAANWGLTGAHFTITQIISAGATGTVPSSDAVYTALAGKEPTLAAGTAGQYYRGDKTWQAHDKASVGLGNVDNTSDANKPVSNAQQTALNGKEASIAAGTAAQYWRGDKTWQTLDKTAVGLGSVDNTADAAKPVSNAQAAALALKAPLAAPALTGTVTADALSLNALAQSLHSGAVVKAILYDTAKDSDGGAWRQRCGATSWYAETLSGNWQGQRANEAACRAVSGATTNDYYQNTTDGKFYKLNAGSGQTEVFRGNVREFPQLAAIVAEAARVVVYDMTAPNCPMWMVFVGAAGGLARLSLQAAAALNGILYFGYSGNGMVLANLVADSGYMVYSSTLYTGPYLGTVGQRNAALGFDNRGPKYAPLASNVVNDIAVTTLPGAPVDPATNLPVATVAVATSSGVSVLQDSGLTRHSSVSSAFYRVAFDRRNNLWAADYANNASLYYGAPGELGAGYAALKSYAASSTPSTTWNFGASSVSGPCTIGRSGVALSAPSGITLLRDNPSSYVAGMVANICKDWNSGWMVGDIRGAWLSDVVAETVSSGELVSNGTFNTSVAGWTLVSGGNGATFAYNAGGGLITQGGTSTYVHVYQAITTVIGQAYALTADLISATSSSSKISVGNAVPTSGADYGAAIASSGYGVAGSKSVAFTATATTTYVVITDAQAASSTSRWDNISVGAELVGNGDFGSGLTTGWTPSVASLSVVSGAMRVTASGASPLANYNITTVVGRTYRFQMQYVATSGKTLNMNAPGAALFIGTVPGTYALDFVATSTTSTITVSGASNCVNGDTYDVDNVSVKVVEPDRCVKAAGLPIVGSITKTAVASGAQLMFYSGFSASNYLEQPYASNLDFGTGDVWISFWAVNTQAATQIVLERGDASSTAGRIYVFIASDGKVTFALQNALTGASLVTNNVLYVGTTTKVDLVRKAGVLSAYFNGIKDTASGVANTANISHTTAALRVGNGVVSNTGAAAKLALLRIGATAPSDDQIAHMYRDEAPLFLAGAQCTLAGTSSGVTTQAFDDTTEVLQVGTSWGRSALHGLLRVDSEATSVGALVSLASDHGALLQGGATSARLTQPSMALRDELRRRDEARLAQARLPTFRDVDAVTSQTAFVLPAGYTVRAVHQAGTLKRAGSGKDYTVAFDGYLETVNFTVAPGNGVWVSMMLARQ
jgi:hypothetical protein